MLLSISSYSWLPGTFIGQFHLLSNYGIEAVEIFCTPRHLDINDAEEVQQASIKLRESDFRMISMHAPSGIGDISSPNEMERDDTVLSCQRAIDAATLMGASLITFHPSSIEGEQSERAERWPALGETLRELAGYAEDRDMRIAVENFPSPFFGCDPQEMYQKIDELNLPNVGMCLDIGHAFVGGFLPDVISDFGEKIFSVHASDNRGKVDEHLPPGQGHVPWETIFDCLRQIDFKGPLVVEVRDGRKFEQTLQNVIEFSDRTGIQPIGQLSH